MRKLFTLILGLGAAPMLHAQQSGYKPMAYSSNVVTVKKANYIKKLSPRYISTDKKYVSDWNNYLYDIYETYTTASREKQFITESYVAKYLQGVLQPILDANRISEKIEVICTRYQGVNAYNMGDSRLYVNIGVLGRLENEAQLAFLLGHELSHFLLQHSQDKFKTARSVAKDKSVKAEIRDIREAKYNKLDRAAQFAMKHSYTFASYSRQQERAADSLAIVLLKPTKYDIGEGKGLMRILKESETDSTTIDYSRYLSGKDKKLRPELIADNRYSISFGNKRAIAFEEDSLKSHPDIPLRIAFVDEKVQQMTGREEAEKFVVSHSVFDSIKAASRYEILESYDANERYAASMYHALSLLQKQPESTYLIKTAAFSFRDVVLAVKNHTIQDHVPIESESNASAYNQLLRIIDRTTLTELMQLYRNFIDKYSAQLDSYPELKQVP